MKWVYLLVTLLVHLFDGTNEMAFGYITQVYIRINLYALLIGRFHIFILYLGKIYIDCQTNSSRDVTVTKYCMLGNPHKL